LNEHLHFVQGVAWDPAGQFLASISADRTCRIYSCQSAPTSKKQKNGLENSLYQCQQVLAKTDLMPSKSNGKTDADSSSLKVNRQFITQFISTILEQMIGAFYCSDPFITLLSQV
jgi:WD40 repeat protein